MAGSDHYRYAKHYVHLGVPTAAPLPTTAASNCSRLLAVHTAAPDSGALVRPEEAAILLVVLAIWVAAIALFFDRFEHRPPSPAGGARSGGWTPTSPPSSRNPRQSPPRRGAGLLPGHTAPLLLDP